jgi:CHASE1-domain containing sensor protein
MLSFFGLFTAIFIRVSKWEHHEALLEFRLLSQQTIDKIRTGLEEQEVFLEQLERSFSMSVPLSRTDFRHLVQSLLQRFPTLQAVEWVPRIQSDQRASFEAAQQADLPGFEIREIDPLGHPRRAGERAEYYPVTYIEPLRGNEQAVGFDLASNPDRKAALQRTIGSEAIAATTPIRLVQEKGEEAGILLMFAVPGGVNGTGVLLVVLRMGTFVDRMLTPVNSLVSVELSDLNANKVISNRSLPRAIGSIYTHNFAFGGRHYAVRTQPTTSYLEQHRRWQSWAVLVVGVFSTGLLGRCCCSVPVTRDASRRWWTNVPAIWRMSTGASRSRSESASRPKRHYAKPREWRRPDSSPAASRTTSTTCSW